MRAFERSCRRHALFREVSKWQYHSSTSVTGGRTSGIVGMLGPELLVDVPAALWECWVEDFDSRTGNPWQGDQPEDWRASDPKTSGHQPKNSTGRRYFLILR